MLMDQNTEDVAHYIKERNNLEQEISHRCNFEAFLSIKAVERNNQDIEHRKGGYKSHVLNTNCVFTLQFCDQPLNAYEGILI